MKIIIITVRLASYPIARNSDLAMVLFDMVAIK